MRVDKIPAGNPGPYTGSGNNTWLVHGPAPLLIDAGAGEPAHAEALEQVLGGAPLHTVLITHAHHDHTGGARLIRDRWPSARFLKWPWPERDGQLDVGVEPLADGDRIPAGDGVLTIVHTPGHSPDHVCAWDPESQTVFTGDLLIEGGTVVIPASRGGRLRDYLQSLERVRDLHARRALPAHGREIDDPARLIGDYIVHRARRERQVIEALHEGAATPAAIVRRMYDLVPEALRGAAEESVLAHLMKLKDEGRAVVEAAADGPVWRLAPTGSE